jgi:hypothetical protein
MLRSDCILAQAEAESMPFENARITALYVDKADAFNVLRSRELRGRLLGRATVRSYESTVKDLIRNTETSADV